MNDDDLLPDSTSPEIPEDCLNNLKLALAYSEKKETPPSERIPAFDRLINDPSLPALRHLACDRFGVAELTSSAVGRIIDLIAYKAYEMDETGAVGSKAGDTQLADAVVFLEEAIRAARPERATTSDRVLDMWRAFKAARPLSNQPSGTQQGEEEKLSAGGPPVRLPDLRPTARAVLAIIKTMKGKGLSGKEIVLRLKKEGITLEPRSLRRHIIPTLKVHFGVMNQPSRGGYYIDQGNRITQPTNSSPAPCQ